MVTLSAQQGDAVKSIATWFKGFDFSFSKPYFELTGYAGSGKAQPLTAKIQTPNGPVEMGSLQVGDTIFSDDGTLTTVEGIFPQGVVPTYRVTFRDGFSTESTADHLWNFWSTKRKVYDTLPLQWLIDCGAKRPSGDYRTKVPLTTPVSYPKKDYVIDPYILGVLLGDGGLAGNVIILTTPDTEIVTEVESRLPEMIKLASRQAVGCSHYTFLNATDSYRNPFISELRRLDLRCLSYSKHVPAEYKYGSVEQRLDILRGLMDTDGSCKNNRTSFSTISPRLVDDISELVQSLGGIAIHKRMDRTASGRGIEYHVNIKMPVNPFLLSRKADNWSPSWKNPPSRYVTNVEYIGDKECQCIKVATVSGLYLTDHYIVTHNTTLLPAIVDGVGLLPEDIAFCSPTGKAAKVMTGKMKGMGIGATARTIHSTIYLPNAHRVEVLERQLKDLRKYYDDFKERGDVPPNYTNFPSEVIGQKIGEDILYVTNELDRAYGMDSTPSFTLNLESAVRDKKLIIVDEASMVGTKMAQDIMSFNIPVLSIGDKGQLSPIQDTWGFLTDNSDFTLTEIHRQAADNPIIWLATLARQGKDLPPGMHGDTVNVVRRSKDTATYDMDRELQVIVGTHKRKWNVTNLIRKAASYDNPAPMEGEVLIVAKNSLKDENIINGTFLTCAEDVPDFVHGRTTFPMKVIDETGNKKTLITFQGLFEQYSLRKKGGATATPQQAFKAQKQHENVEWGHAITCHRSQGSQWNEVVLHDEGGVFGEDAARWRYTGITRAAERLTVVI